MDEDLFFDYLLGEWRLKDTTETIEKIVEIRGGGRSAYVDATGQVTIGDLYASTSIQLGHATDTTLTRSSAGVLAVEGIVVPTISSTNTLTNKRITSRTEAVSDATSISPNWDSYDRTTQANTQAAGTLTINAPTYATANDGDIRRLRIKSTNVQTFSFNAAYVGSTDTPLPVSTYAGSTYIYLVWEYNSTAAKWHLVSVTDGYA